MVGPKSNTAGVLRKRGRRDTGRRWLRTSHGQRRRTDSPSRLPEGASPADTLALGLSCPEPGENDLAGEAAWPVALGYGRTCYPCPNSGFTEARHPLAWSLPLVLQGDGIGPEDGDHPASTGWPSSRHASQVFPGQTAVSDVGNEGCGSPEAHPLSQTPCTPPRRQYTRILKSPTPQSHGFWRRGLWEVIKVKWDRRGHKRLGLT